MTPKAIADCGLTQSVLWKFWSNISTALEAPSNPSFFFTCSNQGRDTVWSDFRHFIECTRMDKWRLVAKCNSSGPLFPSLPFFLLSVAHLLHCRSSLRPREPRDPTACQTLIILSSPGQTGSRPMGSIVKVQTLGREPRLLTWAVREETNKNW